MFVCYVLLEFKLLLLVLLRNMNFAFKDDVVNLLPSALLLTLWKSHYRVAKIDVLRSRLSYH